jgi:RHS repeat-associated protein
MLREPLTGLYHTHFREYSNLHGRWLSEDPAGYADGLNLYAYCGGDAVNAVDPVGLEDIPAASSSQWQDYERWKKEREAENARWWEQCKPTNWAVQVRRDSEWLDEQGRAGRPAEQMPRAPSADSRGEQKSLGDQLYEWEVKHEAGLWLLAEVLGWLHLHPGCADAYRTSQTGRASGARDSVAPREPRPGFYVTPGGQAIPATGYRAVGGRAVDEALTGTISPRPHPGTHITFDDISRMSQRQARDLLQLPRTPSHAVRFDTLQVVDDLKIPTEYWGEGLFPEPRTISLPKWGTGGGTQAVTTRPIIVSPSDVIPLRP